MTGNLSSLLKLIVFQCNKYSPVLPPAFRKSHWMVNIWMCTLSWEVLSAALVNDFTWKPFKCKSAVCDQMFWNVFCEFPVQCLMLFRLKHSVHVQHLYMNSGNKILFDKTRINLWIFLLSDILWEHLKHSGSDVMNGSHWNIRINQLKSSLIIWCCIYYQCAPGVDTSSPAGGGRDTTVTIENLTEHAHRRWPGSVADKQPSTTLRWVKFSGFPLRLPSKCLKSRCCGCSSTSGSPRPPRRSSGCSGEP